jgi:hypothetical protein
MKSIETLNEDGTKTIKIYSTYSDAQKRATQKYRINNKDKVNEQRKKYYITRKEKDPEFLNYKRAKAKEYYQKKKGISKPDTVTVSVVEEIVIPEPIIEAKPDVIEVVEKKKRKVTKKEISIPEPLKEEVLKVIEEPVVILPVKKIKKERKPIKA